MRYLCIHSHFYQPPRENPWLDIVEIQDSAAPYHDWNARIAAECYWPNAAARLLGHGNHITAIVNNYEALSFNFGPTLTAWFARHEPALLHRIVEADRLSRRRHAGHGNAIAQVYGHAILPLASPRDQVTQVSWGIQDFVSRFDRKPEGMWLPETAVNIPTLEALAAHNIKFTILAPHQAKRIRPLGQTTWHNVAADQLNTNRPYLCRLPSGKRMVLFFYNSGLAHGVAFEGLLNSGDRFVERILAAFQPDEEEPQLVHLATDGESYGHHHRFGEMALAFAVHEIEQRRLARVTNYGEYLAFFPPQWEVEIVGNTSWSCTHGVERWRADCGCRVGSHSGWTQQWRAPLRTALDWLRDKIDRLFEQRGETLLLDPWAARDAYVEILLEHTPGRIEEFCARHARKTLSMNEKVEVLKLLEMQHHRLLMFTSCGWFFDELSGLEGVQILHYAARALELAESFGVSSLESEFIERLRSAPSNIPEWENGARVYAQQVQPAQVSFPRVVANQAICGILEREQACPSPAAFSLARSDYDEEVYGATALGVGRISVSSRFTQEAREFSFAVLRVTSHDVHCVVSETLGGPSYEQAKTDLMRIFARHSLSEVVRELDRVFGEAYYTAKDLFLDDRRRVLGRVSEGVLDDLEEGYRRLYEENRRLMEYLRELEVPLPRGFSLAAEFLLDRGFTRAAAEVVRTGSDGTRLEELLAEARKWRVPLETRTAEDMICQAVEARVSSLVESPLSEDALRALHLLDLIERLGLTPNLWRAQTLFAEACRRHLRTLLARRVHEEPVAYQLMILRRLAEQLGFYAVDGIPVDTWEQSEEG